jgi:hypothetical protein
MLARQVHLLDPDRREILAGEYLKTDWQNQEAV